MNRKRETAMRADFATYARLENAAVHATMTDKMEQLAEQQARIADRWTRRRSDRRHWLYLTISYRRALESARWGNDRPFYRNGERDEDAEINQRSLNLVRLLTEVEQTRAQRQTTVDVHELDGPDDDLDDAICPNCYGDGFRRQGSGNDFVCAVCRHRFPFAERHTLRHGSELV